MHGRLEQFQSHGMASYYLIPLQLKHKLIMLSGQLMQRRPAIGCTLSRSMSSDAACVPKQARGATPDWYIKWSVFQAKGILYLSSSSDRKQCMLAVGSPYRAPAMAPGFPPAPITFAFVVRLSLATPADFTQPLRDLWCQRLLAGTTGANCTITSVAAGSVVVVTEMSYAATDAASEGALASRLQSIQSGNSAMANTLFGPNFGTIEVVSIATTAGECWR